MDHISRQKKLCEYFPDGNEFCYKFKEDVDNVDHSKPSASKFYFNEQKRAVPENASDILTLENVKQNCGFFCDEELEGLMTAQTPESLIPVSAPVGATFPNLYHSSVPNHVSGAKCFIMQLQLFL